ncbi:hypothetical protein [Anaerostipes sp.]|uniref:hypothetical protein n=1 Tax=Anaerostipes sp. TaxID=1872530 RepID=UPI0025C48191|nr:hypothetical protein [Anaerostipes sp.]MBS7008456.1 hypothetical protein [Anaerostipes sp.]
MKRRWKRLAVFLAVVVLGAGNHVLFAVEEKETKQGLENGMETESSMAVDAESEKMKEEEKSETTAEVLAPVPYEQTENQTELPEIGGGGKQ